MRVPCHTIGSSRQAARTTAIWFILAGVPVWSESARAQIDDGGPIVIGENKALEFFHLTNDNLAIEWWAEFDSSEIDPATGRSTKDTETRFLEILEYSGNAFMGHPNLFELDFLARWELEQRDSDLESTGQDESTFESLLEFEARGTYRKSSDTPITIFAERKQTIFKRDFGGTLDNTQTNFGITTRFLNGAFPSVFTAQHREMDQENSFDRTTFKQKRNVLEWNGSLLPAAGHVLSWDTTYETIDESGNLRNTNSFERLDLAVDEEFRFGTKDRHRLHSEIIFRDETGHFPFRQLRWDERLYLELTKSLQAEYILTVDQSERRGSTQSSVNGSTTLRHQLFDSLTTVWQAGANRFSLENDDFRSTEKFISMNTEYTKAVPFGTLFASADLGANFLDESERGSPIFINDQSHTFGFSGIIILAQRNIITSSILITDLTGTIIYAESVDYNIDDFGERVEIRRIPGGLIAPNQTVLIDFEVGPEPASTTNTLSYGLTGRYDFNDGFLRGLSLYARYRELQQERNSAGSEILPVSELSEWTYGAEYEIWRLWFLAEQKIHDSTLSPFDTTRFEAEYRQLFGRDHSLRIRGLHQIMDRGSSGFESTITNVTARFNSRINTRWSAEAWATYRQESNSNDRDFRGFEQSLELNLRHRQTTLSLSINNTWSETNTNRNTFQTIAIGFRREF